MGTVGVEGVVMAKEHAAGEACRIAGDSAACSELRAEASDAVEAGGP